MEAQNGKPESLSWHNERRKVSDLIPFEGNPRRMTDKQQEELQESLEKFDLVEVPAIDLDNRIIAGHQRLAILVGLGRGGEEIDVRVPNRKLTDEEFKEYNLRSNKNTGEWDWDSLKVLGDDLLLAVGFDQLTIDKFLVSTDELDKVQTKEYNFGGASYAVYVGNYHAELSEDEFQMVRERIQDIGGFDEFVRQVILGVHT